MTSVRSWVSAGCIAAFGLTAPAALAQVKFDISIPWGPSEFHTVNAGTFAKRVAEATGGEVQMTVHPGGSLGVKASESVRAVADGIVAMAEFAAFQNVGDIPILGMESLPFLVDDYAQLRIMQDLVRPAWVEALAKRNQRVLYSVPWPSQNFFLKKPINTLADLKGVKMRTYDKNTTEMVTKVGMLAQQMNTTDIVPALAAGRIEGVMTSGTTAVAQKYWEFLNYCYNTNHLWASNLVVINNDAWKKVKPAHQAAIEKIAQELEPKFWEISQGEHTKRMAELQANGMKIAPASPELKKALRDATRPMWDEFAKRVGPDAGRLLAEYRAKTGK